MNVTGPGSHFPTPPVRPAAAPAAPAPARPATHAAPAAAASATAASDVPAGSDPALWSVLTADERAFFQKQAALGPLTYGRARPASPADAPLGQRIDVRA